MYHLKPPSRNYISFRREFNLLFIPAIYSESWQESKSIQLCLTFRQHVCQLEAGQGSNGASRGNQSWWKYLVYLKVQNEYIFWVLIRFRCDLALSVHLSIYLFVENSIVIEGSNRGELKLLEILYTYSSSLVLKMSKMRYGLKTNSQVVRW